MTAHSELLARLEGASEGSRELDREIMGLFYRMGERCIGIECDCCPDGRHVTPVWIDPETDEWKTTALDGFEFTTSVDADLALAERLGLDGWNTLYAAMMNWKAHDPRGPLSGTLPLAMCIAVLRAKEPDGEKT